MNKHASIKNVGFMPSLVDGLLKDGDFVQAREIVAGAIDTLSENEADSLLHCKILLCKVERAATNFHEALRVHLEAYPLAMASDNHYLRARFFAGLATTYAEIGARDGVPQYFDRAFVEYEAARFHFEEDGDREGAGYIENSIAVLKSELGLIDEAREHLGKARSYFSDPVKLAEIEVTAGEISLKENKSFEALASLTSSCAVFAQTGNKKLLDQSIDALIKAAVDYKVTK